MVVFADHQDVRVYADLNGFRYLFPVGCTFAKQEKESEDREKLEDCEKSNIE